MLTEKLASATIDMVSAFPIETLGVQMKFDENDLYEVYRAATKARAQLDVEDYRLSFGAEPQAVTRLAYQRHSEPHAIAFVQELSQMFADSVNGKPVAAFGQFANGAKAAAAVREAGNTMLELNGYDVIRPSRMHDGEVRRYKAMTDAVIKQLLSMR